MTGQTLPLTYRRAATLPPAQAAAEELSALEELYHSIPHNEVGHKGLGAQNYLRREIIKKIGLGGVSQPEAERLADGLIWTTMRKAYDLGCAQWKTGVPTAATA